MKMHIGDKTKMKSLLILGAGGFGQMVKETAGMLGYEEVVFFWMTRQRGLMWSVSAVII